MSRGYFPSWNPNLPRANATVLANKSTPSYKVTFELTEGALIALAYAIHNHQTPAGRDNNRALQRALEVPELSAHGMNWGLFARTELTLPEDKA